MLCEQAAPLLQRGLEQKQQEQLAAIFAADALCLDLTKRLSGQFDQVQLDQALALLDIPVAKDFTEAERAVGEDGVQGLATYRQQLSERAPRQARMALVRRLDAAAHTSRWPRCCAMRSARLRRFWPFRGGEKASTSKL